MEDRTRHWERRIHNGAASFLHFNPKFLHSQANEEDDK
jgi:hypothetical protein